MIDTNNAAGRLHLVLQTMLKQHENQKANAAWPDVLQDLELLGAPDSEGASLTTHQLLRRLSPILALPNEVRRQLDQSVPKEVDHFTQHLHLADKALTSSINLEVQWKSVVQYIPQEVLTELFHCSRELSRHDLEPVAALDDVKAIHQRVRDLFNEIENADMETELRTYLLKYLSLLDEALREFRITGMEGVRQAAYAAAGAWIIEQPDKEESARSGSIKSRFSGILATIFYITGIASNLGSMLTGVPVIPPEMVFGEMQQLESGEIESKQGGSEGTAKKD